jgi:hypothetical protein
MTARVTVSDRDVQRALAALARLGRDPSPPMKAVGRLLVASTRNRMVAEQAPDGSAWPRLNPAYAALAKVRTMQRLDGEDDLLPLFDLT